MAHEHERHHHHGGHAGHRHADFDWEAMADQLEVDGTMALPLVTAVVDGLGLDPARVAHVVDAGSGPGVVTCALAARFPDARVTGVDSAAALLARLGRRAAAAGLGSRTVTVEADLDAGLPTVAPADLVWASMVVHHAQNRGGMLGRLAELLRPGGVLVLIEHGGSPQVLPDGDPLVAAGTWRRLEEATSEALIRRLGFDVYGHDWPADLTAAGLTAVSDRSVDFRHEAPLSDTGRRWLVRHIRRGIGMAEDGVPPADSAALAALADAVERGERPDCFVDARRRVLTARRPDA